VREVLGGGPHEGRPADVDQLDAGVRGERVQVDHHQVDRLDAVLCHLRRVVRLVPVGEDAAVHLRVQRHHAMIEDRGHTRHLGDIGDVDSGGGESRRRSTRRDDAPPGCDKAPRELLDPRFVVDAE